MSKNITPMQKLKHNLTEFEAVIQHLKYQIKNLNKKEPSYNQYSDSGHSKGVDSDFIRIYYFDKFTSIAFKFTFLNGNEFVEISLKEVFNDENHYYNSNLFSIPEAKIFLKSLNILLKMKGDFNTDFLYSTIKSFVVSNSDSESDNIEIFKERLAIKAKDKIENLRSEEKALIDLDEKIKKSKKLLFDFKNNMEEKKEIIKLEKMVSDLHRIIRDKKEKEKSKLCINDDIAETGVKKNNILSLKGEINKISIDVNNETKLSYKKIQSILKNFFESK